MVKDDGVFPSEVVWVLACVLKHGWFVLAKGIGCSGCVLVEACGDRSLRFTYIYAWARLMVCTCAEYAVNIAIQFFLFQFVFGFDQIFCLVSLFVSLSLCSHCLSLWLLPLYLHLSLWLFVSFSHFFSPEEGWCFSVEILGINDISTFVYDPSNTIIMPQQQSSNFHRN